MAQDKKARRQAARDEEARRQREREQNSPITREDLDALYGWLAQSVFDDGHTGTLDLTRSWLTSNAKDVAAVVTFLESNGATNDFDVLTQADPNRLFGPANGRLARMPLEAGELTMLIDYIDKALADTPCSHDLRMTRRWLADRSLPVAATEFALIAQGGGCDCEVLLNVELERIFSDSL